MQSKFIYMTGVQVLVRNLGRIPYTYGIELQKELAIKYQNANQRRVVCYCLFYGVHVNKFSTLPTHTHTHTKCTQAGEILFCEHDAVYTFGLRQKEYALEAARLERLGAQVFKVRLRRPQTYFGLPIWLTYIQVPNLLACR